MLSICGELWAFVRYWGWPHMPWHMRRLQEGFMPGTTRMARVFQNGRNQAVRIPREFEFAVRDVEIRRQGDSLILSARPQDWAALTGALAGSGAVATGEFLRWLESPAEGE
jgi:virulence-associated protein VagC